MIHKRTILAWLLLFCLVLSTYADNPVLCKLHQVAGTWKFTFGTKTVRKGDNNYDRMTWGRHQPAQIVVFNQDADEQQRLLNEIQEVSEGEENTTREIWFKLTDNDNHLYQYLDGEGKDESSLTTVGNWTMVLHEGMLGFYFDRDVDEMISIDTFWRYNLIEGDDTFESVCYETMVGWYHTMLPNNPDDEQWGCFFAKKAPTARDLKEKIIFKNGNPDLKEGKQRNQWVDDEIERAENGQESWFTKQGANKAKDSSFVRVSPTLGNKAESSDLRDSVNRDNEGRLSELGEYLDLVGRDPNTIDSKDLPRNFNWNNINGYSFFPEVENQECGDCYQHAFARSFESRVMIYTNGKLHPKLSLGQIKDCIWYTEGCDGGLPINIAKYGWEFQLVSEECYPFIQETCGWDTILSEDCEKYYVQDFYFTGWNYGGASEELIMKEIIAHGPVASVINAPSFLQMYGGGILTEDCPADPKFISKKNGRSSRFQNQAHISSSLSLWEQNIEWEYVNHSIVILGWGEESHVSNKRCETGKASTYWIVANSWGNTFGENGFFKLRRGCNDFAIESEALSVIPLLDESVLDPHFITE